MASGRTKRLIASRSSGKPEAAARISPSSCPSPSPNCRPRISAITLPWRRRTRWRDDPDRDNRRGLSAATAVVVVESVALSIMVSNNLILPAVAALRATVHRRALRRGRLRNLAGAPAGDRRHFRSPISITAPPARRRWPRSDLVVRLRRANSAPAHVGALLWRRGTALGAIAGLVTHGVAIWAYALLAVLDANWPPSRPRGKLSTASVGTWPTARCGSARQRLPMWCFRWCGGRHPIERLQADLFIGKSRPPMAQAFRLWRSSVPAAEVRDGRRPLSRRRAHPRGFRKFLHLAAPQATTPRGEAPRYSSARHRRTLLASAIGGGVVAAGAFRCCAAATSRRPRR